MTPAVIYDTGMLIGLTNRDRGILAEHARITRQVGPLVPGPVLAQAWRGGTSARRALSWYLKGCEVFTRYTIDDYKRVGVMLGAVHLPGKKRPDVVDALVTLTAAGRGPAVIATSDPSDIEAYLDTIPKADVQVVSV